MNKRLKVLRLNMKMTQKQFAKYLGITSSLLSQYENDTRSIPDSVIDKICTHFFVDKLWLLYGDFAESYNFLSQIKKSAIAILANLDDNILNHLIHNILKFIEDNMESTIDNKVLSYQMELEAEKKGQMFIVLLNINGKKLIKNNFY